MKKLSILALSLCLLLSGCQLAKPEAQAAQNPEGIWMELHEEGFQPPEGYAPAIDFDAPGALGLLMKEETIGPDGEPVATYGTKLSPYFLDVGFGSHTNMENNDVTVQSEKFKGTLYLDANEGAAPEEIWMWYIYRAADGSLYGDSKPCNVMYPRHYSMSLNGEPDYGGEYSQTISTKTASTLGQGREDSYTIGFKRIGRLERVRILEFDKDFNRLSSVELEVQNEDEYRTKSETAYVTVEETYRANGKTTVQCETYSASDAIDYDGDQALYHSCKYMEPNGVVLARGLKIVF